MSYYLFELEFSTPVHFGDSASAKSLASCAETVCADTLFSALCHEANRFEGAIGVQKLIDAVSGGELKLSDMFPYRGAELFVPRPIFPPKAQLLSNPNDRKKLKKLAWIPASELQNYCRGILGTGAIEPEKLSGRFGESCATVSVSLQGMECSVPYSVGRYIFDADCGLYGIAQGDAQTLRYIGHLLSRLGFSGLGGKLSAGCGKFSVRKAMLSDEAAGLDASVRDLFSALGQSDAPAQLLLTTALPRDDEMASALEGACYSLKRRGGFVQSATFAPTPQKKQTQYFLAAGSVLRRRFEGGLREVALRPGAHPVYRYAAPLFLGAEL